jgi:hypothetical protein
MSCPLLKSVLRLAVFAAAEIRVRPMRMIMVKRFVVARQAAVAKTMTTMA